VTALDVARDYLARGWQPIPVPRGTKIPTLDGWPELRLTEETLPEHFNGGPNVGVLNGAPSGGIVDGDLDAREAVVLADTFLPPTRARFGRRSKPNSHRIYVASPLIETTKFQDVDEGPDDDDGTMLVELRSTGTQTVFPGSVNPTGEVVEWVEDGEPAAVDGRELLAATTRLAVAAMLARHWPERGGRHEAALAAAGFLLRAGLDEGMAVLIVGAAARAAGDPEWQDRKRAALDTAAALAAGEPATGGPTLADLLRGDGARVVKRLRKWLGVEDRGEGFTLTDAGNALRFARDHGQDVRFCWELGRWFEYDGCRWRRDPGNGVMRRMKATARSIYAEAARATDPDVRKRTAAWGVKSESEPALRRALILAQSEPALIVRVEQLDADPFLLNTPAGTVELRTSHLRPHRREDYITRMTAAPYIAGARHPVWDAFLARVVPDQEVRGYLQRCAGYGCTGETSEEKMLAGHGPTAGGKTTFTLALRNALGDYAGTADVSTFCSTEGRARSGPREDLARLDGLRLVVAAEVEDGSKLAAGLVKMLFGGDTLVARELYKASREIKPTFKLFLVANHRLRAPDDDEALWRRVVEIPFTESLPPAERDPAVKATLTDPAQAGAAILAWAVEGAAMWFEGGLREPKAVRDATEAYRRSMDPLGDFLGGPLVLDPLGEIQATALREAYEAWCREQGIRHPLGGKAFGGRLRRHGCKDFRRHGGTRWWQGLRSRTVADDPPDPAAVTESGSGDGIDGIPSNSSHARAHEESYGNSPLFRHPDPIPSPEAEEAEL
jgi:putative DNA primase/helicase